MTAKAILSELEALGSAQTRKIYKRHGVGDNQYGVSYANLKTLKKKIKVDHNAALQLWATGNHDARILATMIADPKQADESLLDAWADDLSNYVVTDAFAGYAGKTAFLHQKMEAWIGSDDEWKGHAGWNLLSFLTTKGEALPDDFFEPYLTIIARDIHTRKNRVRYAMNTALISIGMRSDALEQKAVAVAEQTGTVEVDHGETGCKTPDAASYIRKSRERMRARAGKK
jgi:3-methyladenine DNA glycosylase AlkD